MIDAVDVGLCAGIAVVMLSAALIVRVIWMAVRNDDLNDV